MPYCEPCSRFYNPNSLADDDCPDCGRALATGEVATAAASAGVHRVPWHFWLLLGALVIYLGWRLIQGIAWAVG